MGWAGGGAVSLCSLCPSKKFTVFSCPRRFSLFVPHLTCTSPTLSLHICLNTTSLLIVLNWYCNGVSTSTTLVSINPIKFNF